MEHSDDNISSEDGTSDLTRVVADETVNVTGFGSNGLVPLTHAAKPVYVNQVISNQRNGAIKSKNSVSLPPSTSVNTRSQKNCKIYVRNTEMHNVSNGGNILDGINSRYVAVDDCCSDESKCLSSLSKKNFLKQPKQSVNNRPTTQKV